MASDQPTLPALIDAARAAHRSGERDDALTLYAALLERARAEGRTDGVVDVLRWMGVLHSERGELERAGERIRESLVAAQAATLTGGVGAALVCLGNLHYLRGELREAEDEFGRAREVALALGDQRLLAMVEMNTAVLANIRGDVEQALASYRAAVNSYHELGDQRNAAGALNNIGMAQVDLGNLVEARQAFDEAAEIASRTNDADMARRVDLNRAELHLRRQDYEGARHSVELSLDAARRLRSDAGLAEAYRFYGVICRETGKPRQADTYFGLGLALAEAAQDRLLQAETEMERGLLYLEDAGRREAGIRALNRSLRGFRALDARREVQDIEKRLSRLEGAYLPALGEWTSASGGAIAAWREGHGRRVSEYATALGREVGITGWDLTWLTAGALIHDVGCVPAAAGDRTAVGGDHTDHGAWDVRGEARSHVLIGETLAAGLEFPEEVRPIVRGHHESW